MNVMITTNYTLKSKK